MNRYHQDRKDFLETQLEWVKKQDAILGEMDEKLHEMKRLAEYARDHELTSLETDELNQRLNVLKQEVDSLDKQLRSVVH